MLSILIPIYNYNVLPLVLELQKQCLKAKIDFEILCQDDASKSIHNVNNQNINDFENCSFFENEINLGRGNNINSLAKKSKFEYILILDCDTKPVNNFFILRYILEIHSNVKIVFGGLKYQDSKPEKEQLLRWVYGKKREVIKVEKRKINPNKTLTCNILVQKNIFLENPFESSITVYGYEDLVFLTNLKFKNILVKHIENPVFHLGLETSAVFLEKTKIALQNLKHISSQTKIKTGLIEKYELIEKLHLKKIFIFIYNQLVKIYIKNLLSSNPSIFIFDLYRLGFYCALK